MTSKYALQKCTLAVIFAILVTAGMAGLSSNAAEHANSRWDIPEGVDEGAGYLARAVDDQGRFIYLMSDDGQRIEPKKYNILRHSGAIYALAEYQIQGQNADIREKAAASAKRAAAQLISHYIRPLAIDHSLLAVWSDPNEERGVTSTAKLGGAALSIIGLVNLYRATNGMSHDLDVAQGLARFVQSMQESNGNFTAKYTEEGETPDFESLYYPGEAALALTMLYEVDHNRKWLDTAMRGVSYLVIARRDPENLPADHWLMIAIDRLLPYYSLASEPKASKEEVIDHAVALGKMMMDGQAKVAREHPDIDGCFTGNGRTTPSATRLEGLLALEHILTGDAKRASVQSEVHASIARGMAFVRRAQITSGPTRGAFPATARGFEDGPNDSGKRSYVRIDYVQHALMALMRYTLMCKSEKLDCPG